MFSAYHREGFRACVEAEAAEFLKDNHDVLEVWLLLNLVWVYVANLLITKHVRKKKNLACLLNTDRLGILEIVP